jgi:hypothetical protein
MLTRSEFRFGLLFFLVAIVPPSIWVPQELSYWLDGWQPLSPSEASTAMGAGRCKDMYCSATVRDPSPVPTAGNGCAGKGFWTCPWYNCYSCNPPVANSWYRVCIGGIGVTCTPHISGTTPCGKQIYDPCIWTFPFGPCTCRPVLTTVYWWDCPKSDCTR